MAEQRIQTEVVVAQAGKPWLISGTAAQNSFAESCDMATTNCEVPLLSSWLLLTWWALVTGLLASSKATLWDSLVGSAPRDTMELPLSWQSCQLSIKPPLLDGWQRKALGASWLVQASPFSNNMVRILPHFMLMGTLGSSFTWMMLETNPASMAGFAQRWPCWKICSVCGLPCNRFCLLVEISVALSPYVLMVCSNTPTHISVPES